MAVAKTYAQILTDLASGTGGGAPASVTTETLQDLAASTHPNGPATFGKGGTQNPIPGVVRYVGGPGPAFAAVDPGSGVLGQPLLATATVTSQVKTSNQVDFSIAGRVFRKAATDNFVTLTGGVQPISTWRKYWVLVDSAGAATVLQCANDSLVSAAAVVLPAPPAGKAVFGVVTIATDGVTTFTPGTTLLGAAGITTTYADGLDATFATNLPANALPSIVMGAANGATSIASSTFYAAGTASGALNTAVPWRYANANMVGFSSSRAVPATVQNTNQTGAVFSPEMELDDDKFEFVTNANGINSGWRMLVDGQYVNPSGTTPDQGAPAGGAAYRFLVTFPYRAIRSIRLEFSSDTVWRGMNIGPTAGAWPPLKPLGPRVIFAGDSYTYSAGPVTTLGGWAQTASRRMGWDGWPSGQGTTGYLATTAGVKFGDRIQTDIIDKAPDIVVIAFGANDIGAFTAAQVGDEAAKDYAAIKAGLPNVKLIVLGPFRVTGVLTANDIAMRDAIKQAALNAGAIFIDNLIATVASTTTLSWITVGNAAVYVGPDTVHYTYAGYDYIAARFCQALAAQMPF